MATVSLAATSPLVSTPHGVASPAARTAFVCLRTFGVPATRFFSGLAAAPLPAGRSAAAALVPMAKREQDLEEIRGMSTEQVEEEVVDLKGELFLLRLKRSARQEFKNSEFSRMRKRVYSSLNCLLFVLSVGCEVQIHLGKWHSL
jgi:large subunit ribosomal protein L29